MQFTEQDLKRMSWHSRRGMLELDLILVPFADNQLSTLTAHQLFQYQELLAQEDQDLFTWFIGKEKAPTLALQQIIELIKDRL